jgi:hypothetical protein
MCWEGHLGTMGWSSDSPEWEIKIMMALAELQENFFKNIPAGHLDILSYEFKPIQQDVLKVIEIIKKIKNGEIIKTDFRPLGEIGFSNDDTEYRKDIIGAYCKFCNMVDKIAKHLHKIILSLEKIKNNPSINLCN